MRFCGRRPIVGIAVRAAGNIADRLRHGAIVDFIAIGRYPLFNLADVAIVAGVGMLVLSLVET
jgi:signal peptidase II